MARPIPAKGLVIDEKRQRKDSISSPNKKGKVVDSSKGKVATPVPEEEGKTHQGGELKGHSCIKARGGHLGQPWDHPGA